MYICLNTVIDEYSKKHTEHIDVSGFIKERNVNYSIDLMDWDNVLYLNIHPDTLKNFNKNTIIAEVLWEITFNGYSPDDIDSFCKKLTNSFDNYK